MKRRIMSALGALIAALLAVVLLPASPARATSVYDDTVVIGQLKAVNPVYGEIDLSTTFWLQVEEAPLATINWHEYDCAEYLPDLGVIEPGMTGGWMYVQGDKSVTLYSSETYDNSVPFVFRTTNSGSYPNLNYSRRVRPPSSASFRYVSLSYLFDRSDNPATTFDERLSISCGTTSSPSIAMKYQPYNDVPTWMAKPILSTIPVEYPAGYEGVQIPQTWSPPPPTYVAMGDSFSAGEGNPPFEGSTGTNGCHRSSVAYPRLLESELGEADFVACSGATTNDVINGKGGEPSQVDRLYNDVDVATMTVGGNDIGFQQFAEACVYGSCANDSLAFQESWGILTDITRDDNLPLNLSVLLSAMQDRLYLNSDAEVYVIGYPYVITPESWAARGVGVCTDFDEEEALAAQILVSKLDEVIEQAISDLDDARFVYVDPLASGNPFSGHELCRSGGYFNGLDEGLANPAYVFHPNEYGQQAYADLVDDYID